MRTDREAPNSIGKNELARLKRARDPRNGALW